MTTMTHEQDIFNRQPINDPKAVRALIESGPQLCFVLNKNIDPEHHINLVQRYYIFHVLIKGEPRSIQLYGAHKYKEVVFEIKPEETKKTLGEVPTQVGGELVTFGDEPYALFSESWSPQVVEVMKKIYEIRKIDYEGQDRLGIYCFYFDEANTEAMPGQVVAQHTRLG